MFTIGFETWEVRNRGNDPKIPVDAFPTVQVVKIAVRDERGRFHGATNFRLRGEKQAQNKSENEGTRVSRRATGLRLVK